MNLNYKLLALKYMGRYEVSGQLEMLLVRNEELVQTQSFL
jgi:hypothetical protein